MDSGRAVADGCLEIDPFQQLHGHEEAAGVLAEVVHHHDVRMAEPRGRLRLAVEALPTLLVSRGDDFQRHVAVEDRSVGAEDFTHGALTDALDDPVLADLVHARIGKRGR